MTWPRQDGRDGRAGRAGRAGRDGRGRRLGRSTRRHPLLLVGLLAALCAGVASSGCEADDEPENTAPAVPPPPALNRIELDAFELEWPPSTDDSTPPRSIVYEVGVVDTDICIVSEAEVALTGQTELSWRLDQSFPATPFVGFTVRALDQQERSAGYGPCVWGLREPVRLPVPMVTRSPRLPAPPAVGPSLGCRSDGHDGVWCATATELSHFRTLRWQAFPLPRPFGLAGWVPIDDYNALARSDQIQLHLSRANGTSAGVISSSSQRFDTLAGSISTGRQRAYVGVRGFVGEFETRHLDMAGPPQAALGLPGPCDRLVQLGDAGSLGFALCRVADEAGVESHHLFLGEPERRVIAWRTDPVVVDGDRVEGVVGNLEAGWAAVSSPGDAELIAWEGDSLRRESVVLPPSPNRLEGTPERPIVAISGSAESPFVIAHRHFDHQVFDGLTWEPIPSRPQDPERLVWHDVELPRVSHLVGSRSGIFAISDERSVLLSADSAELRLVHPGNAVASRGHDARTYLLRGPELREVLSSREGLSWFTHNWRGPPLEPHDLAVTPSGGIYISGLTRSPGAPADTARPVVFKLTSEGADDASPPLPPGLDASSGELALSRLAADERGRLYAHLLGHVAVLDAGSDEWHIIGPVPGRLIGLVGLDSGALAALETLDGPGLLHCQHEVCVEVPVPMAARRPWAGLMRHEGGFCVGVRSRALWCRQGQDDTWIDISITPSLAERYDLGPDDEWDIVSAIEPSPGEWLMAVRTPDDGFLVAVDLEADATGLVARGIDWANGDVLLSMDDVAIELGRVVGIEAQGPAEIRFGDNRVSVPGTLYR